MSQVIKNEQKAQGGFSNSILASVYKKLVRTTPVAEFEPLNLLPDPEPVESHRDIAERVFCNMQDGLYRKSIISESVYAKAENIPTLMEAIESDRVYPLPEVMDAPFECIDNKEVGRVSQTIWILYYIDGHVETHVPTPTVGRMLVGCDMLDIHNPPDKMPEDVFNAIRVTLGTELVDNSLRGCRWSHYSK